MSEPLELTRQQRKILREGILGAYPEPDALKIILDEEMDVQLGVIARGDAYENKVFNLIEDFQSDGRIEEFIRAVVADKPNSPFLSAIKKEFAGILGEDNTDEKIKTLCYIGEAENCWERLAQHNREEDFWKSSSSLSRIVNDLKFKASYAIVGNNVGGFPYLSTFSNRPVIR